MRIPHTKNTLSQAATSQPTKQSLQESIFSPTQKKLKNKKFPSLQKNKTSFHRTVQTLTDIVLNVNRFGQPDCKLDSVNLRTDSRAAHNMQLSEILKKGAVVVNQTVVLLMKCVQVQFFATQESGRNFFYFVAKNCVNSCASNPPFLKLRQALMR